ncbi:MAG: MFS transporter [Fimbriimonadaceae bacterium]|nr:MFS transporter [Fimbriimonadaceae bacterium]
MACRWLPRSSGFLLAACLCEAAVGASAITLTLWLDREFHASQQVIGFLGALPTLCYISTTMLMGGLADRLGRRRMALAGTALMTVCLAGLALCRSPWTMLPLLALRGVGAAMFWPPLASWLSQGTDAASLPRRMAAYNIGWSSGSMLGSVLAGWLYAAWGARAALGIDAALMLLLVLLTWRLPRLSDQVEEPVGPVSSSAAGDRRSAWLASFAAFFTVNLARALLPQYLRVLLDLDPGTTGALLALLAAVQTAVFVDLGLLHPHLGAGQLVVPGLLGAALGLGLLALPSIAAACAAMLLLGLNCGITYTASLFHSLHGRADAGRQSGINEAVVGAGGMLGPALGGLVATGAGPQAPWVLGAALLLATVYLARRPLTRRRSAT